VGEVCHSFHKKKRLPAYSRFFPSLLAYNPLEGLPLIRQIGISRVHVVHPT